MNVALSPSMVAIPHKGSLMLKSQWPMVTYESVDFVSTKFTKFSPEV